MKKAQLYLFLTISLLILLFIQSIKYNYLMNYKISEEIPTIIIENNNKIYNIEDFIILLQNENVSISTLTNEKNKFKAILNFNGNIDELIKYVKYLEEKEFIISSYEIKKDEFFQCTMEVNT
ncbi:hypothetical protein [Clostridium tarantellae]|uniref:Uncharacterized protein n=1 Tax=Clostridium tarantellae TaxID=39493 RepID=A0A6I1MR46_9CLOT|nr:hypothetical protein [Clostridium tarantellae]MPQ42769.1 hypothetical protein [Clostridium tarantellae]